MLIPLTAREQRSCSLGVVTMVTNRMVGGRSQEENGRNGAGRFKSQLRTNVLSFRWPFVVAIRGRILPR